MKLDFIDRMRIAIAVASVITLVALLYLFSLDDEPTFSINGDSLGQMATEESFGQYSHRAEQSVQVAQEEWPEEKSFGLISFSQGMDAESAAEITQDLGRVNAMLVGVTVPFALPEPVENNTRQDVYEHQLSLLAPRLEAMAMPEEITAVIAWETPATFAQVAQIEEVATVEVLPPDAAWGNFGVSPVHVPGAV